MSGQKKLVFMP